MKQQSLFFFVFSFSGHNKIHQQQTKNHTTPKPTRNPSSHQRCTHASAPRLPIRRPAGVHIFISIIVTSVHPTARTARPTVGRGHPSAKQQNHQRQTQHRVAHNKPSLGRRVEHRRRNGRRRFVGAGRLDGEQRGRRRRRATRLGSVGRPAGHLDEHVSVRLSRRTDHVSRQTYRREVSAPRSALCAVTYFVLG